MLGYELFSSRFNTLDSTTFNHSVRVMSIAQEIEDYYHLPDDKLSMAALVHDIGKIYVSSKILDKKGNLSVLERELVDLHPYIGYRILKSFDVDEDICRLVLYHHGPDPTVIEYVPEYDNENIMDLANLLHSIDSYEALTSDRSYHRGYLANEALDIMLKESGHHKKFIDYLCHITQKPSYESRSKVFRNHENNEHSHINVVFENLIGTDVYGNDGLIARDPFISKRKMAFYR